MKQCLLGLISLPHGVKRTCSLDENSPSTTLTNSSYEAWISHAFKMTPFKVNTACHIQSFQSWPSRPKDSPIRWAMEASLPHPQFASVSREAKTMHKESREVYANREPTHHSTQTRKSGANAMECAVLLLPSSHQVDAGLPDMFLELREDRIGRTGHTITARNWAGITEVITLNKILMIKTTGSENYFTYLDWTTDILSGSVVKNLPTSAGDAGDRGSILGLKRFPWSRKWLLTPVFLPRKSHG